MWRDKLFTNTQIVIFQPIGSCSNYSLLGTDAFMRLLYIVITLSIAPPTFAQTAFTIYGGVANPTGDFGDDTGPNSGNAKTGFLLGAEIAVPVDSWLYAVGSLGATLNDFGDNEQGNLGSWLAIPAMAGLRLQGATSGRTLIYGQGLAGWSYTRSPSLSVSTGTEEAKLSSGSTTFGFQVGGGVVLANRIDIGVRFADLGSPEFNERVLINSGGNPTGAGDDVELPGSSGYITRDLKTNITMFQVILGIRL